MYNGEVRALEPHEMQRFLEVADTKTDPVRFTAYALLFTGMRASELAHMDETWLRERENDTPRIFVPAHKPCSCSDCMQKAEQSDEHGPEDYWRPKSASGARSIPVPVEDGWTVIKSYMRARGEVGVTRGTIWDRIRRVAEDMDLEHPLSPHVLRHTYGTESVARGMGIEHLQGIMGHKSIQNTQVYVNLTGDQTAKAAAEAWDGY